MLFNSLDYILLFLPAVVIAYFVCARYLPGRVAELVLLFASLLFYSTGGQSNVLLILFSILCNYALGQYLSRDGSAALLRLPALAIGIAGNLAILGYYKYSNFLLDNINTLLSANLPSLELILPLAISFFTFQQITYLVDSYSGVVDEHNLVRYGVFVTFFPQLIAGPIVHHKEMMPQFSDAGMRTPRQQNILCGCFIFTIGLAKKVLLADQFAVWANFGYEQPELLSAAQAWACTLSYTLQLYFDFSGYADMAIGAALMLNIRLPDNFNSPYRSLNIQDFWRRWHMTLGRFLRDYIYIPAGGQRRGKKRLYFNLLLTFFLGGIWHGAGWTFVIWGLLHGLAQVTFRIWNLGQRRLPPLLGWMLTFLFVHLAWVFFRAESLSDALMMLSKMVGIGASSAAAWSTPDHASQSMLTYLLEELRSPLLSSNDYYYIGYSWLLIGLGLALCMLPWNSAILRDKLRWHGKFGLQAGFSALFAVTVVYMHFASSSEFLYFNF